MRYAGSTTEAQAPFIPGGFWEIGTQLSGKIVYLFNLGNRPSAAIKLDAPMDINGQKQSTVSFGIKAGIYMAIRACGLQDFQPGDRVKIECVGATDTGKESKRSDFKVEIDRERPSLPSGLFVDGERFRQR